MKYFFLFIFCFFFSAIATAQLSVHTGFTAGTNQYSFTVDGQEDVLQPGTGEELTFGVPIRIAKGTWSFQTGIYTTNLSRAYYFKTPDGSQYGSKDDDETTLSTLKVPLIVSKEFKLIKGISLAPKVGLAWLTNRTDSDSTEVLNGTINETDFQEIGSVTHVVNKNKFLAEAGIDLNIYPFRHFILTAGVTYNYGLQSIETTDVTYSINGEEFTETLVSKGNALSFHVGLSIPIHILHGGHKRVLFD